MKRIFHYWTISAMFIALFSVSETFGTDSPDTKHSWSTPKLSGRLHLESFTVNQPGNADPNYMDKAGLRELRLTITGTGYRQ